MELSYLQKSQLPYSLLLDPTTGTAAAYTNNHRLITDQASDELVAYAIANCAKRDPFDPVKHARGVAQPPEWRPLPTWAVPKVLGRLEVLWIQRPGADASDAAWRAIPPR